MQLLYILYRGRNAIFKSRNDAVWRYLSLVSNDQCHKVPLLY